MKHINALQFFTFCINYEQHENLRATKKCPATAFWHVQVLSKPSMFMHACMLVRTEARYITNEEDELACKPSKQAQCN